MSVLGIPVMNKPCFQNTENDIGKWWNLRLQEAMLEAGREKKRLAEERNNFHQGVPAITVIVDGWILQNKGQGNTRRGYWNRAGD